MILDLMKSYSVACDKTRECLNLVGRSYKCQNLCLTLRLEQKEMVRDSQFDMMEKGGGSELDNQNLVLTRSWSLVILLGWRADCTPFFARIRSNVQW